MNKKLTDREKLRSLIETMKSFDFVKNSETTANGLNDFEKLLNIRSYWNEDGSACWQSTKYAIEMISDLVHHYSELLNKNEQN